MVFEGVRTKVEVCKRGRTAVSSAFTGEPGKVGQDSRNQIAVVRVGGGKFRGIQVQDVARLGRRLGPRTGRHRKQLDFDDALTVAQQLGVGFDLGEQAADAGGLLDRKSVV